MLSWIKSNGAGLFLVSVGAAFLTFAVFGSGCTLDQLIKVPVPQDVRAVTGSAQTVTLAEAPTVLAKYDAAHDASRQKFASSIEDATWLYGMGEMLVNLGVDAGGTALAGVPGGAIGVAILTGLGGLFLNKPGAKKRAKEDTEKAVKDAVEELLKTHVPVESVQKEKEASFNKALEVGRKLAAA